MKIYMVTDLEGVSGVVHPEHTGWDGRRHLEARTWLTEHINAAVEASVAAGASEVLVLDGHSNGRNVLLDRLHPAATLMWGRQNRRLGQMEGIDASFAAVLMLGFHARAGSAPAVLNHTINSGVVSEITINGRPVGEIELNAGLAGEFGVPVAMVSGEARATEEALEFMPHIETAPVMWAVGTYAARILPQSRAHEVIRAAVGRALARLDEMRPVRFDAPIEVVLRFQDTAMAEAAAMVPGVERLDGRACGYSCEDFLEAYRMILVMITLGATETWTRTA
jgi:D-amino peptidase